MKTSIRTQVTVSALLIALIPLLLLGIGNIISSSQTITSIVTDDINDTIDYAINRTEWELTSFQNIAVDMGATPIMSDPSTTNELRSELIAQRAALHGLVRGNYIDADGNGIDGNNYSDREYFIQGMQGNPWISEPVVSKITGELTVIISAPVWKGGTVGSEVVGVVYFVPDGEFLNDIVRSITLSEDSMAYIIDKNGYTIADVDTETVKNGKRVEDMAKDDKSLAGLAAIHLKMQAGESGFESVSVFGESCYIAYRPIAGTNGWSLGVYAPEEDFFGSLYISYIVNAVILVAGASLAVIFSLRLGNMLGRPIHIITERLSLLTEGDISSPLPEIKSNNEIGVLAEKTHFLLDFLKSIIGDVSNVLQELSEGNLTVKKEISASSYVGEFSSIATSMHNLKEGLTATITQMSETSNQVNISSAQLSSSAQGLAQGATEQAESVENLANMLHDMSTQIEHNRKDCIKAKTLSDDAKTNVAAAADKSNELHNAMSDIREASGSIDNIIKTIDNIAFQTNILALNAAIEAARAGVAGKGFAVVADEVRNLATKSSEAVQETTALIERSNASVQRGAEIAEEMKEAMRAVDKCTDEVAEIIELVTDASEAQAKNVTQITAGIDKITDVVQNNTSAAEETAAASEELTGQANSLNEMVGRYRM